MWRQVIRFAVIAAYTYVTAFNYGRSDSGRWVPMLGTGFVRLSRNLRFVELRPVISHARFEGVLSQIS